MRNMLYTKDEYVVVTFDDNTALYYEVTGTFGTDNWLTLITGKQLENYEQ